MIKKLVLLLLLSGCVETSADRSTGQGVLRSNSVMTQEFLDLVFMTETGNAVPELLKYNKEIRVSLGPSLSQYRQDLEKILQTIRRGSGVDIRLANGGAQIHIQQIPARVMNRNFPTAACVVASGVGSWAAFQRGESRRWSSQRQLGKSTIFIPDDAPPYIVRACLNEEIGQALGPVNDLYYVADTIFNDDNVHSRLTDFDLLMLRVLYDARLPAGIGRAAAGPIVERILQDINPDGRRAGSPHIPNPQWQQHIVTAITGSNSRSTRATAAQQAVTAARRSGDHRLAYSLLIYGRLKLGGAPHLAGPAFEESYDLLMDQLGPNNLRTALAAMHVAAMALATKQYQKTLDITTVALATARRHEDAVLVAGIQSIRALAFGALGLDDDAARARLDSLAQARYAFGADAERIALAQEQIAGLIPARQ